MPIPKTNAMRKLDQAKIPYQTHTYCVEDGQLDGISVAHKLSIDPQRVFKTLLTHDPKGQAYVCIVPVAHELDLKKAARHFGVKSLRMLPVSELLPTSGYVRGGCSPIGMKKLFPTVLDESARAQSHILVSAGRIGQQIELAAADLCKLCRADMADLKEEV